LELGGSIVLKDYEKHQTLLNGIRILIIKGGVAH